MRDLSLGWDSVDLYMFLRGGTRTGANVLTSSLLNLVKECPGLCEAELSKYETNDPIGIQSYLGEVVPGK